MAWHGPTMYFLQALLEDVLMQIIPKGICFPYGVSCASCFAGIEMRKVRKREKETEGEYNMVALAHECCGLPTVWPDEISGQTLA